MSRVSAAPEFTAAIPAWRQLFETGRADALLLEWYGEGSERQWRGRYLSALDSFVDDFGGDGEVAISRCPAQMNVMGMHIDYCGMPSLRMAIRGSDTITVARAGVGDRVRLRSLLENGSRFPDVDFAMREMVPTADVSTREGIMTYAGEVCSRRELETGSALDSHWDIIPEGGLIFLDSYLRRNGAARGIGGMDAAVWSNVSPSGGMSSSSALLVSTAYAALGAHGLDPKIAVGEEDLVDGLGSSEWLRGTRGGTADHGGMIMGRVGSLVSVGVLPAHSSGRAPLPDGYAPMILDSKVPRVYDEAAKEETVAAYSLGTFVIRELLLPELSGAGGHPAFVGLASDYAERIHYLRDLRAARIGMGTAAICQLLAGLPAAVSSREVAEWARKAGRGDAYERMFESEIAGKYQHLGPDVPIYLRRRVTFALAEQSRVEQMVTLIASGRMQEALELIRISHAGDRDREVELQELERLQRRAEAGEEGLGLALIPGGYGRMTEAYDRVVGCINDYLQSSRLAEAGAVQRLGAGWGGNIGGLVRTELVSGPLAVEFRRFLHDELALDDTPNPTVPGEGACLVPAPG